MKEKVTEKKSWKVQESEYVRVNVLKSEMNTTFRFVTNTAPDEINRLTSEVKKQGESTCDAVERKIQMFKHYKTLKKGEIYTIVEKSDNKQGWIIFDSENTQINVGKEHLNCTF